ncbi:MAG: hypothetical protein LQ350_008373 [Teloschistes chrysophthalmus]|nr:MAG: hypothetical protein LQ350_008373 [Niorma chrysophthalma]
MALEKLPWMESHDDKAILPRLGQALSKVSIVQGARYIYHVEGITDVEDIAKIVVKVWPGIFRSQPCQFRDLLDQSRMFSLFLSQQPEPYQESARCFHREITITQGKFEKVYHALPNSETLREVLKREKHIAKLVRSHFDCDIRPDRYRALAREPVEKHLSESI